MCLFLARNEGDLKQVTQRMRGGCEMHFKNFQSLLQKAHCTINIGIIFSQKVSTRELIALPSRVLRVRLRTVKCLWASVFLICGQENQPPPVCVEKGGPWVELGDSLYLSSDPTKAASNQPTTATAQPWVLMKPHHTTVGDKCTGDREQATSKSTTNSHEGPFEGPQCKTPFCFQWF